MSFDLEKTIGIFKQYGVEYLELFFMTLYSPALRFSPSGVSGIDVSSNVDGLNMGSGNAAGFRLSPKLLVFAIISVFIGLVLQSQAFNGEERDLTVTFIMAFFLWVMYSIFIHLLCRLFRGKGTFLQTISVSVQLFATIYVCASFIALLVGPLLRPYAYVSIVLGFPEISISLWVYMFAQFILLAVYLPLAIRKIHKLNSLTLWLLLALLLPVVVFFSNFEFIKREGHPIGKVKPRGLVYTDTEERSHKFNTSKGSS